MPLRPIFSSLARHKLTVFLLVLQVTFTCAIVCNVIFMITIRTTQMRLPSGVAENELVLIDSVGIDATENPQARHEADLAALRGIAGVTSAAAVDSLPLNRDNWTNGITTVPDADTHVGASAYNGTPGELATLGLALVEGRDFHVDEYIPEDVANGYKGIDSVPATIVTRALAEKLFPGQSALGKNIYASGNHPTRIVGVVDHMLRPSLADATTSGYAMLFPMLPDDSEVLYVLRTAPQDRERVMTDAMAVLKKLSGNRILKKPMTFTQLRDSYFRRDRTMIGLLLASGLGLLFVTALGIAGLANFWVQQRSRSIGIRRAIGATRGDILRYFQAENFLIVTGGIGLGMLLAYVLNLVLMSHYELPRLPLYYLPVGAMVLWLLGQLAVLGPALRAAAVPPVVATRSV
ncbi:MAG: FtsX-like permease family protein [Rhodanobacter sp.]